MRNRVASVVAFFASAVAAVTGPGASAAEPAAAPDVPKPPRLVLQITVDQLRGDMVTRMAGRWGEGGFRRLLDTGAHYANTHYDHSTTFTAVSQCVAPSASEASR